MRLGLLSLASADSLTRDVGIKVEEVVVGVGHEVNDWGHDAAVEVEPGGGGGQEVGIF